MAEEKKTLGTEIPKLDESYIADLKPLPEKIDGIDIKQTLSYYVNVITKYIRGKATLEDLNELGDNMTIREYIPMKEKFRLVATAIFQMNAESDEMAETMMLVREKNLFFDVLLTSYCGIYCENQNLKTYATYDLLYPTLAKYILQFCGEDYKMIRSMIEGSLNIYRMKELNNVLESVDYTELKKAAKANEELLKKFYEEKEALDKLKELFLATDDNARKVVEMAKNESVVEAGEKLTGKTEKAIEEKKEEPKVEEVVEKPKKKAGRPKKNKE